MYVRDMLLSYVLLCNYDILPLKNYYRLKKVVFELKPQIYFETKIFTRGSNLLKIGENKTVSPFTRPLKVVLVYTFN